MANAYATSIYDNSMLAQQSQWATQTATVDTSNWGSIVVSSGRSETRSHKLAKDLKEERFEKMGREPVVKEIMAGAVKVDDTQKKERVRWHLENVG